jgi:hypothetical protein
MRVGHVVHEVLVEIDELAGEIVDVEFFWFALWEVTFGVEEVERVSVEFPKQHTNGIAVSDDEDGFPGLFANKLFNEFEDSLSDIVMRFSGFTTFGVVAFFRRHAFSFFHVFLHFVIAFAFDTAKGDFSDERFFDHL